MRLFITRGVHAAVTVASPKAAIVIDPGFFGYPASVDTAAAVLVTHDHFVHVDLAKLAESLKRNAALRVYAPTPLDLGGESRRVTLVKEGDAFTVGDLPVRVIGKEQATASLDDGPIANVGYLIAESLLHPGDARPELQHIDTLFTALAAPWQNNPQLEGYLRAVEPRRVIGLHDATLSDLGRDFAQKTLEKIARSYGGEAIALNAGDSVTLDIPNPS